MKSSKKSSTAKADTHIDNSWPRALSGINYRLMELSCIIIVVGFLLMLGSSSTTETYNPDIFSARRIVVGPTIAFLGYIFMGVAIMWNKVKPNKKA